MKIGTYTSNIKPCVKLPLIHHKIAAYQMYKIREMFVYMSDIEEIFLSDRPQVVNLNKLCAGRKSAPVH